jgi:hypothetical protein
MPHLRDKFNEWEDHWYPKMLPMDDRAVPRTPASVNDIQLPEAVRRGAAVGGGGGASGA